MLFSKMIRNILLGRIKRNGEGMNKSETIGALSLAVSKLLGEVQNTVKDTQGFGYKYTKLDKVLDMVRPLLEKHELSLMQLVVNDASNPAVVGVEGLLSHSSGEWVSSTVYMPVEPKKNLSLAQSSGVVISYIRRYQIAALLGIAQKDTDAAISKTAEKPVVPEIHLTLKKLIIEKQLENKIDEWCKFYKISDLSELRDEQMKNLIKRIEEAN